MQTAITSNSIKRNWLIILLLLTVLMNHVFLLPKISIVLTYIFVGIYFLIDTKYKNFYRLLLPWCSILLTGLIFSMNFEARDVIRDIFYFINPLFFLILGSFIAINFNLDKFFKIIVLTGSILSIIYVAETIVKFGFSFMENSYDIRANIGVGNSISVLALIILIFSSKFDELHLVHNMKFRVLLVGVNLLALILFSSRTYTGIAIILLVSLSYPLYKKNIFRYILFTSFGVALAIFLINQFKETVFIEKMLNSVFEISMTNDIDPNNPYANYRGYEAKSAIDTYTHADDFQKIVGLGFGKLIDLKSYYLLGGELRRFIPILHNGFAYLLVKTGVLGCILFLMFLINIMKLAHQTYKYSEIISVTTIGVLLSLCFATYIVSGFFNSEFEILMIILGGLIQYMIMNRLDHQRSLA